jgi:hypothetical protein
MCCAAKMPFAPDNGYESLEVAPSPAGWSPEITLRRRKRGGLDRDWARLRR